MRALLGIAALLGLAGQAQAAESPALEGVWSGTIGTLPVRACLMDASVEPARGSYYYLSQKEPIPLNQLDGAKGWQEDAGAKARWTIALQGNGRITGSWTTGDRTLPIALSRVAMGDDGELDGACRASAYLAPRIIPLKPVAKAETKGKFSYSHWQYPVDKSLEDTVDIAIFQIPLQRPGDKAINARLRGLLDPAEGRANYADCMLGSIWQSGRDGDFYLSAAPSFASSEWIDAEVNEGGYCGGAHPSGATSHMVFDRGSGKEVQLATWLAPRGMSANWDAEAKVWNTRLLAPLRKRVIAAMPENDDADCRAAVAEADYWNLSLTPKGIGFTPSLAHVMQACEDTAELSFAELAPWLSPAGKTAAARMKAPVLAP